MNTYKVSDPNFRKTEVFKEFMTKYPKIGYLKVRAYSANEAIPLVGLGVIVSIIYDNDKMIFYEGKTNSSGIVENIKLPAPAISIDNLDVPHYLTYNIEIVYPHNVDKTYKVNIYDGIHAVQNINVAPQMDSKGEIEWL